MAESFISAIAENVLSKLGSPAYQELALAWGVKNDIEQLKDTLTTISAVLLDAEEQQNHSHKLRVWLEKLKEVCYDAEDVLDEIEVEAVRKQVVKERGSITLKVRNFLSSSDSLAFRFKVGHKIKKIRERLDKIADEKDKFNLTADRIENKHVMCNERETYSFVDASKIIGRDEDKENIVNLLRDSCDTAHITVLPIVGIGGLGKTTVAKMVYNDKRIEEYFELKMWICISDEFIIKKIIIDIIKSAIGQNYSNMDMDQLQKLLRDTLGDKKFLLVMDDVWKEDLVLWTELRDLLERDMRGNKIIVTTRSHKVASIMGTVPSYNLGGLSHQECFSLFIKCAFREGQEKQHPHLMKIGEEIVNRCGGIPLAVKTLGSLLHFSNDVKDWENVRDNDMWKMKEKENEILHALRISYDHLPSYLKQCFAYCSIFPKDRLFGETDLITFWMAHKLLQSHDKNKDLEKIGIQYIKELMSRSFLQDIEQFYDQDAYEFKIHDLMNDLAASLMKNECLTVKEDSHFCPKTVRHLSFVDADEHKIDLPSFLSDSCNVRTISFSYQCLGPSQSFLESVVSKFPVLRMLNLRDCDIEVLPKRIGNLKHLRYLDISYNHKIKKLPTSICKLHNLQALGFGGCEELKELPRDTKYLISLRTLWLTTKQNYLPKNGIGCLNSLRKLYIRYCHNLEYLFEDIGGLGLLQELVIRDCQSLISLPHGIKYLRSLENLILINCEKLKLDISMGSEREDNHLDLNSRRPQLRVLDIDQLPHLVELPHWLLQCCSHTLQTLYITNCSNFTVLPESMQHLKSLRALAIGACPKLSSLPMDMYGLTALRKLNIEGCPALSERCKPEVGEDWSNIAHVSEIWLDGEMIESSNF